MNRFEARPTEYKGIRFKSKSEAMVAFILDQLKWTWMYEPPRWQLEDGWVPDFAYIVGDEQDQSPINYIIEYKPVYPTETYINELKKRFNKLRIKRLTQPYVGIKMETCLLSGNAFNENFKLTVFYENNEKYDFSLFTSSMCLAARQFRFDLRQNNIVANYRPWE